MPWDGMFRFLCSMLLPATMTGDLCHGQNEMIVTVAEVDCSAEERPVPAEIPETRPESEMDYYSQARKALSLRSPFDVSEEKQASTSASPTLPNGLAAFLSHRSDNRGRRRKKSQTGSGAEKNKTSKGGDKNIWVETEEYFRELTLPDIDTLLELSNSTSRLVARNCFSIPVAPPGNAPRLGVIGGVDGKWSDEKLSSVAAKNEGSLVGDEKGNDEKLHSEVGDVKGGNLVGNGRVDDHKDRDNSACDVSLEWLLGCRNKIPVASERPLKRRKVTGGDIGLEKVIFTVPNDGKTYCDYCGRAGDNESSNRIIVCASCKVAVHRKCYAVEGDVEESWLCSWCKQKDDTEEMANPCVLCPNKGGALKPVNRHGEGDGSVQFAHLFCCLWTPEVYVNDLKKMEAVTHMGGIKDNRRKSTCNVCKLKYGACIRCSHGTCGTSFHPWCARKARHRMEVWAKYGSDNVELHAFCCKHSDLQERSSNLRLSDPIAAVGCEISDANDLLVRLPRNRSNTGMASDSSPDKLSHNELDDGGLSDCMIIAQDMLGCDAERQLFNAGIVDGTSGNVGSINFELVFKKLIERGKVDVKEAALEIGISPEAFITNVNDACTAPDVRLKIINWLKAHVYPNALHKDLKVKFKPADSSKDENDVATHDSDTSLISDQGLLDPVAVKSVPPRRRTISNIRVSKDNKVMHPCEALRGENGMPNEDAFAEVQGIDDLPCKSSLSSHSSDDKFPIPLQNESILSDQHHTVHSTSEESDSSLINTEGSTCYIHPYINKLLQIHKGMFSENIACPKEDRISSLIESSRASGCSSDQYQHFTCSDDQVNMEQLVRDRKMGVLECAVEDEVEGEIVYLQHMLLQNAVKRKEFADNLIFSVAKSLPQEIDTEHQQRWDAVFVNQYLCDLREAKKKGRKEKKHMEAQAVLAAAAAAVATSSRVSSLRKDSLDESMQKENLVKRDASSARAGTCSQPVPRAKETLLRVPVARTSSEKYSDFGLPPSDRSKDHPILCDICRRSETMLNPILVCSGCKVAVHLDCYRSEKETTGPWFCELCEFLSSRNFGAPATNYWEKPQFVAECCLCGGTTGAFRKTSDGRWVHAFCAEWASELAFRRGQVHAVERMETVLMGVNICCVCGHKHGVCIKCNYGNCQSSFHPLCARNAGWYMTTRIAGKPPYHKAYCGRHSSEQRAKAETQKHGIDELKNLRRIRVELERLRLLCERIVKREKLKRELVQCSQDILASKRDHVARSVLVHSSFFFPDGSSESATTTLNANTEGNRSCSETIQRSDDITVDSSVAAKYGVRVFVSMETDPKMDDDCTTSLNQYNHKIPERKQFSGKRIPYRAASASSHDVLNDGGCRSKLRKPTETFGKELVMTSDEASVKNLKLPKGYAYVRADCLSNDMQSNWDGPVKDDHDR